MITRRILILFFVAVALLGAAIAFVPIPFGKVAYQRGPASKGVIVGGGEPVCPDENPDWRKAQEIDGVRIEESLVCTPDNPAEIAAFVKGTNNISMGPLMNAGLATDAVVLENDRDKDGDPDVVRIKLEVAELNGRSPDVPMPVPSYFIAPGIQPGFWVFVPKAHGMSTKDFISYEANPLLRVPSPTIRVEAGDTVIVTLENTHYLPHTIHFHGVDHPYYLDHPGHGERRGNDGVPEASHRPVMPGESFVYEMTPRQPGTMLYHCHEQPPVHFAMGLVGTFVVEEARPDNWVQTLNVGAGQVRHRSVASKENYDGEYDLLYQDVDKELHDMIKTANDARLIGKLTTREYNPTQATSDYFLLNGRTFPYTFRESIIVVEPNKHYKLRMANVGDDRDIAIHSHGHKFTITDYDGVPHNPAAWITRDVYNMSPAQRLDFVLNTTNDGLHSFGEGAWMMHDHKEAALTTDGQFPGGGITLITYKSYLGEAGVPKLHGVDVRPFFTKEFFERKIPVWTSYDPEGKLADADAVPPALTRPALLAFVAGLLLGGIAFVIRFLRKPAGVR
jgi:FtsP/CotA-like multicopper oxidase with cupredoxin domain